MTNRRGCVVPKNMTEKMRLRMTRTFRRSKDSSMIEHMRKDFENPELEWRRLFGEVFGAFFLVLVAAGADVVNAVSLEAVGRVSTVVAPGVMVDCSEARFVVELDLRGEIHPCLPHLFSPPPVNI